MLNTEVHESQLTYILKQSNMDFTSPMHLLLILLVVMLLFGGKKIPELMRGLGQGMREFKKASRIDDDEDEKPAQVEKKKE
jgi:sec-independent protein translocase protein TatA